MRISTPVMALVLLGFAGEAHAEDRWWARDKALHFTVSGALAVGGYGASSLLLDERYERASAGGALALTAGIAKEVYDEYDYGGASYKDLVFDLAGTAVGVAAAWLLDFAINGPEREPQTSRNARLGLSF